MVKANLKINLLLSGAILIALASSAFAADPQKDDLLNPLDKDSAVMNAQYYGKTAVSLDPNTGSFSTAGFTPVGLDSAKLGSTWIAVPLSDAMKLGAINAALPPPGNAGLNSSADPGTMGRISGSSHTPSISTPSVWIYTPSTPVIPRNISAIISMLPKYQIILGSDFVKRAPDRFLATILTNVISQIVISSPSISMPGKAASGMPESSLIAVVTPRGIAIYAPANPGINTSLPANASMTPSVQLILGPDYMKLAGPGFVGISVGELQATAPVTSAISLAVLKSASQLPGYMGSMPDSSFITVAITPTTAIYIPGNLNNPPAPSHINSPLAVPHSATFAIMPEIGTTTPLANADVENLLPEAKAAPVTQIILSADQIKFEGDGFVSINAGDIKATAPAAEMTQLPDSPFIAIAITSTEAVYMPDSQTITIAKGAMNSKVSDSTGQAPADTLPIVWTVAQTAPEVPSTKINDEGDGYILIATADLKATAPEANVSQIPDSSNIAIAITPTGAVYMPDSQTITIAKGAVNSKVSDSTGQAPADTLPIVWTVAQTAPEVPSNKINDEGDGYILIATADLKATAPEANMSQIPDSSNIAIAITPTGAVYMPDSQTITIAKGAVNSKVSDSTGQAPADTLPIVWTVAQTAPEVPSTKINDEGDGYILIATADLKATAPEANVSQIPDSSNIAIAITPTGAVYMPDSQTITIAKGAVNSKVSDSTGQAPADTLPIVWTVAQTAPEVPSTKTAEPVEHKQINKQEANKPDKDIPVENSKKSIEKPAVQNTNKPTKAVDVKAFISKINKAIVAKSQAFKQKQTIVARRLAKMLSKQAVNIAQKTKNSISDAQKTIVKFVKFVRNTGNNAAGYINRLIKGLIQLFKLFGPNEETPVFILDRNILPLTAMDQQRDPLGPPLQRTQIEDLSGSPVPFGAIISRAIPNRIMNANMFFVDIIKKNAVNYAHTGLSPPQTVSPNSPALLSASKGSVLADSAFVTPACFAELSLFSVNILNKTVSLSLLNAYAFNFKARDFCLFNNMFKKGGSHD